MGAIEGTHFHPMPISNSKVYMCKHVVVVKGGGELLQLKIFMGWKTMDE